MWCHSGLLAYLLERNPFPKGRVFWQWSHSDSFFIRAFTQHVEGVGHCAMLGVRFSPRPGETCRERGQADGHVITPKCHHLIQRSVRLEAEGTAICQEEEARNMHEDRSAGAWAPIRKAELTEGQKLHGHGSVQCFLELTESHGRIPSRE